jgi:hypothetical protein
MELFDFILTAIIIVMIQSLLTIIVHIINGTKTFPNTIWGYCKFLFIGYVLLNLKKLRTD